MARGFAFCVLGCHVVGAAYAVTLLPRGFPVAELHFWSNTAIPVAACLSAIAALVATVKTWRGVSLAMAALAGGWTAAVATGALMFPDSMPVLRAAPGVIVLIAGWGVPALLAGAWCIVAWRIRDRASSLALVAGAALGVLVILAQRGPAPSTRPSGGELAGENGSMLAEPSGSVLRVQCGAHVVRFDPMLRFDSRSPDRTWSILSPIAPGAPVAEQHSSLVVKRTDESAVITRANVEAVARLDAPVYAHLATFARIDFDFPATVAFSATGLTRFAVEKSDYPTGRPTKMAYLGEDGVLRVVKADDGEKGPYHELARGALPRGESLAIEVRPEDGERGCRFVFEDWSAQVSTELSPTAGWGVPQNAIELFARGRYGLIALALASTGPGRGFDSVGHRAGTYRNRVSVEPIPR